MPDELDGVLEGLYELARQGCEKIDSLQPDLVLGLAHSGWLPVIVTRALHEATSPRLFPPTLRTNIGQEKHAVYIRRYGKEFPAYCCSECSDEPLRTGHYLAFLAKKSQWRKELQAQVRAVLGETLPRRILVIDDVFGGLRTGYTVLGLLGALYPQAEALMIAGRCDLTNAFVNRWIRTFALHLAPAIPQNEQPGRIRYNHAWQERLKPLINGSEDVRPSSLYWKPISAESPAVKAVAPKVTTEVALQTPAWAARLACEYALARLSGKFSNQSVTITEDERVIPISQLTIAKEEWAERDTWLERGIEIGKARPGEHRLDDIW